MDIVYNSHTETQIHRIFCSNVLHLVCILLSYARFYKIFYFHSTVDILNTINQMCKRISSSSSLSPSQSVSSLYKHKCKCEKRSDMRRRVELYHFWHFHLCEYKTTELIFLFQKVFIVSHQTTDFPTPSCLTYEKYIFWKQR